MDLDKLVKEEIELDQYRTALNELTSTNKNVFLRTLNKYIKNPSSKAIRDTFLENLDISAKSVLTLRKHNKVPTIEQLLDMNEVLSGLGEYLDAYGYEGKTQEKARRVYLVLHDYLKNLPKRVAEHSEVRSFRPTIGYGVERDEHLCIVQYEKWNPAKIVCVPIQQEYFNDKNYQYAKFYYKVLDENVSRVKKGLSLKTKAEDWDTELSEVETLALSDAIRHLHSGISYLGSRGDLNVFDMSREEQSHRKLLSGASKLLDDINEKRIKKIQSIEGLSEIQLSQDNWLNKRIVELIKRRR